MVDIVTTSGISVRVLVETIPELADLVYEESLEEIEVKPGETKKLVAHTEGTDWVLTRIGATDAQFSEYYLKIGANESPHTKVPAGLFNNPHRFEPALEVKKNVETAYYVKRDALAPGPQKYIAKMIGYKK